MRCLAGGISINTVILDAHAIAINSISKVGRKIKKVIYIKLLCRGLLRHGKARRCFLVTKPEVTGRHAIFRIDCRTTHICVAPSWAQCNRKLSVLALQRNGKNKKKQLNIHMLVEHLHASDGESIIDLSRSLIAKDTAFYGKKPAPGAVFTASSVAI